MTDLGAALLASTIAVPLLMALTVPFIHHPLRLLSWAAIPGLAAALYTPFGDAIELPVILLGFSIRADRVGTVFLGFGALLWLLAGAYARGYMASSERADSFSFFWLLTLTGALGTFIAADAATFYLFFSVLSFAAYGLILHDRTPSARRAGRVYIVLAMLGEIALLAAIMLADTESKSLRFDDIRAALATSPRRDAIFAGILIGFGIKIGLVPVHVWLPLAHPVAPTPASAVLSGIIVKAGVIGLIRFLPMEGASATWGDMLVVLGLVTAYFGIVAGFLESDAKVILAYSTLSQMGLVATVLGSGIGEAGGRVLNVDAVTLYAAHHALAKAALFLSVGLATRAAWPSRPISAVTAFTALAIAGLPLTGGALAKLAIKTPLGEGTAASLVTLSAIGTTLLMLRFLSALAQFGSRDASKDAWRLLIPWFATAAAALAAPWILFPHFSGQPLAYATAPANLWGAFWPILVALASVTVLQIDLVATSEYLVHRAGRDLLRISTSSARLTAGLRRLPSSSPLDFFGAVERMLRRLTLSGPALILIAALFAIALGFR